MNSLLHVAFVHLSSFVRTRMLHCRSLFRAILLCAGWVGLNLQAGVVRLTPDKASGGSMTQLADGSPAISLLGEQSPTNHVTWKLDPPVPAGWSLVEMQVGPTQNTDPESALVFGTPNKQVLVLKYLPLKYQSNSTHQAWLHSPKPISEVYLQKYWLGKLRTIPVREITITPGGKPESDALLLLDSPISGGVVRFPDPLPAGNYAIHIPSGPPRDGFSVGWTENGADARVIRIPVRDFSIYVREPIRELTVTGATNFASINIQHSPLPSAAWDIQKQHERSFIPPIQDKFHSGELVLHSKTPTQALPALTDFPMGNKTAFVMSWDDGVQNDLRCGLALMKHGFRGTFFLVHSAPMMKVCASLEAMGMEIGSHTWSHIPLSQRDPNQSVLECVQMRKAIEEAVGHPILSLAYPFGLTDGYDSRGNFVIQSAQLAGYWSGRITREGQVNLQDQPNLMLMPVSGRWNDATNVLETKWAQVSQRPAGVFHIWGHSWEMVTEDDWTRLDHLLEEFGHRPETWYTTQGDMTVWNWMRHNTRIDPLNVTPTRQVLHVTQPTLHASLETLPITLRIPEEVDDVQWQGAHLKPENGMVNLRWH